MINLKSGSVSYFHSSTNTFLILDSVVAISAPNDTSPTELQVLCAHGGWLGSIDGQLLVAWTVYRITSGVLHISNNVIVHNEAIRSGGGISALDMSSVQVSACDFNQHHASMSGGAVWATGASVVALSSCMPQFNSGESGGAV
jgi:hypothetical protein